jgi:hypothetical protein
MKTKFLIIPINLGYDVSDIINTDLTDLTSESRTELDKAISIAKAAKSIVEAKATAKNEKLLKTQAQANTIYNAILNKPNGITSNEMKELLNSESINLSAVTSKLKAHMKEMNPNLELEKVTRAGTTYYRFTTS